MHDGPSPVFKVIEWSSTTIYLYRPNIAWIWRRWRYQVHRSRSGRVVGRRLFAGPIELAW